MKEPKRKRAAKAKPTPTKEELLARHTEDPRNELLTTDQGVRIPHTDDSLKAGARGPTLLEDFHLREKITRFDHERIPERVVHARGTGAHGFFQVYEPLARYTKAHFLNHPSHKTPVFVRFSTVVGSRGSADTVRDVRGFAVKFYTEEGNFDLVGNNIPVFFIQDGIKFPDLVHALKPEPDREIPQASSAHDSFWDFVSLVPETAHMVMWVMSDRAIPRSYRMMEGFGVHTFRLLNEEGESCLVKFHWKPLLGIHSLVWDEAQKIAGKDPDFHRRDLWEAIESGAFPEYELGLQIVREEDALAFGFDLLDATKILPEELVPVQRVGKLTLNRNPANFFAEVEQVAFCIGNVVPGIDFSNDPLLQARLFSYLDTQLTRLGGPNFAEIPINRPIAPVHNHQHDGFMRQTINTGKANYHPNSIGGGFPALASAKQGAFAHFEERVEGTKIRARSETFQDHFSQAALFFRSLTRPEREHLTGALEFEIGKVERTQVRERVVREILARIHPELAARVAAAVGVTLESGNGAATRAKPAAPATAKAGAGETSPALSQENSPHDSIKSRKIAALVAPGFAGNDVALVKERLEAAGAQLEIVAPTLGPVAGTDGASVLATKTFQTASSVLYDAVFVPGGPKSIKTLTAIDDALEFVHEAFRHCKPIGATGGGVELVVDAGFDDVALGKTGTKKLVADQGVVTIGTAASAAFADEFIEAIARHRHWSRESRTRPDV